MFYFSIISALLIFADYFAKMAAVKYLSFGQELVVIPKFLRFFYVENRGAAFGMFTDFRWLLILVSLGVLAFIVYYVNSEQCKSRIQYTGLMFLFAGTFGNLLNRMFLGYVIDFIDMPHWPTFNLADIFINIGVFLIVYYLLLSPKRDH